MKFINFRKNINIYSEFEYKKFKKAIYSKNGTLDEWYRSVDEKVDNLIKIGKFRQYYILVTALAGKDDNWNDEIEFGYRMDLEKYKEKIELREYIENADYA